MIVKLKCIDNINYDYFTKGKVYNGEPFVGDDCFIVEDDNGFQSVISTVNDFHGKWGVVQ